MDIKPGPLEVRSQLRVLLGRERFIKSPSQAAVLEVIITKWLAHDVMNEKTIGERAFANFTPGNSTDVRTNVFNLRNTLAQYYAEEGAMDLVSIEILKGRKYGVSVSYNQRARAAELYAGALAMMSDVSCYPWLVVDALAYCVKAIELNKDFGPAYALYAELALCYATIRWGDLGRYGVAPPKSVNREVDLARQHAIAALRINKDISRGWIALGTCAACRHNWKLAQKYMDIAAALDPTGVRADAWYVIHRFAIGKKKEAFGMAREKWVSNPPRSVWRALLILMQGVAEQHGNGGVIHMNLDEHNEWNSMEVVADDVYLIEAVNALVFARDGNYREQLPKLEKLRQKVLHKGQHHLLASHGLFAMLRGLSQQGKDEDERDEKEVEFARKVAESLAGHGRTRELATANVDRWTFPPRFGLTSIGGNLVALSLVPERWLQNGETVEMEPLHWEIALAYIGAGEREKAVKHLRLAFDTGNPMATLWLHIWQFLRRLEGSPDFIEMIQEMKLPPGALPERLQKRIDAITANSASPEA